jgi:hypothetical protein
LIASVASRLVAPELADVCADCCVDVCVDACVDVCACVVGRQPVMVVTLAMPTTATAATTPVSPLFLTMTRH